MLISSKTFWRAVYIGIKSKYLISKLWCEMHICTFVYRAIRVHKKVQFDIDLYSCADSSQASSSFHCWQWNGCVAGLQPILRKLILHSRRHCWQWNSFKACKGTHWAERGTFSRIYLVWQWWTELMYRVYLDTSQLKLEDIRTGGFSKYSREELGARFHLQMERHRWSQTKINANI